MLTTNSQKGLKASNRMNVPPGLKFLGWGVTAVAPDDLRDLKRNTILIKSFGIHLFLFNIGFKTFKVHFSVKVQCSCAI